MKNTFDLRSDVRGEYAAIHARHKGSIVESFVDIPTLRQLEALPTRWSVQYTANETFYVFCRNQLVPHNCRKGTMLHRLVSATPPHLFCDHIDRNTLNNRLYNLRNVTLTQNQLNRSDSGVRQVKSGRWAAAVVHRRHYICLGKYSTESDARSAYLGARLALDATEAITHETDALIKPIPMAFELADTVLNRFSPPEAPRGILR